MSRVGKKPILIPPVVQVSLEGQKLSVKGPKGELVFTLPAEIAVELTGSQLHFTPKTGESKRKLTSSQAKKIRSLWGLARNIVANLIDGVVNGCEKKLEISGLGYKAELQAGDLSLSIGFSHPVKVKKPEGINFSIEKNIITIAGIDKELVGQTAASIRQLKLPDPYKAKGIKYVGEIIRKKAGKKAAATTTGK